MGLSISGLLIAAVVGIIALVLLIIGLIYLIVPTFKGIGWLFRQVFNFIAGEVGDAFRVIGALLTALVLVPVVVGNVLIGRWSASAHFGRAVKSEVVAMGRGCYRMLVGHPARLLCITPLTDGFEKRLPEVFAAAPGADKPKGRQRKFEGYTIVGSLPGGGSGARLHVAEPDERTLASLARRGVTDVDQVVIKSFSLDDGSSLPQIVRESRSLDAARRLGLILEHELTDERFYYVMRYVPGDSLTLVTQRLHATSPSDGLGSAELGAAISYARDLVATLRKYHDGGLWHKDVKPDNIIVAGGRAHLVDFGLITPLRSAMTLTTHGTEYFRDPEMVRMALKGVKVHEVDGQRFDVYAAGAVIYSVLENSFPAHGGLSQLSRKCPEALRWIVRRAMTDYDKRYASAGDMLADLDALAAAKDPFKVRPAELPSMSGAEDPMPATPPPFAPDPEVVRVSERLHDPIPAPPTPNAPQTPEAPKRRSRGRGPGSIRLTDWWTGRYAVNADAPVPGPAAPGHTPPAPDRPSRHHRPAHVRPVDQRLPASEQLASARGRAAEMRKRAGERRRDAGKRVRRGRQHASGMNAGVVVPVLMVVGAIGLFGAISVFLPAFSSTSVSVTRSGPEVVIEGRRLAPASINAEDFTVTALELPEGSVTEPVMRTMIVLADGVAHNDDALAVSVEDYRARGLAVVGEVGTDLDEYTEGALARLRAAIGVAPFESEDARDAITQWVRDAGFAGAVAWFQRDASEPTTVRAWILHVDGVEQRVDEPQPLMIDSAGGHMFLAPHAAPPIPPSMPDVPFAKGAA